MLSTVPELSSPRDGKVGFHDHNACVELGF
jgi:hypothetical protein